MKQARWADYPWGFLGMLGVVCAFELAIWQARAVFTPALVMEWRGARREAVDEATRCDLLCFGSSLVKNGVLPNVIAKGTGRRGYNLALQGGSPPAVDFLFRRALAAGARPSTVVVEFAAPRLEDDPCADSSIDALSQLLGCREALDLGLRHRDASFLGRLLTACILPSVRTRHWLRAAVIASLEGQSAAHDLEGIVYARNRRQNRGAFVLPKNPSFREESVHATAVDGSRAWSSHPLNAHYVGRFLDLARARGITVYWLLMPVRPAHQARVDRSRYEEAYAEALRRILTRYPQVVVIDGRHAGFPPDVFVDSIHLDRTGASALSESLAAAMAGGGSARWIDLPVYRTPREEGVEDRVQSVQRIFASSSSRVRR